MRGTTIFLTSDTHFQHTNIIQYCDRPFEDVNHMSEMLVQYWNETVGPDDTVWHLGDVAMGRIAESLPTVGRLNGRKILVPGNHDRCWKGEATGEKLDRWEKAYLDAGFDEIVHDPVPLWYKGVEIHLSHFPFEEIDRHGDKYSAHRTEDHGQFLAHGHIHQAWLKRGNQINVGVDVWDYRPVELAWLAEMFVSEQRVGA